MSAITFRYMKRLNATEILYGNRPVAEIRWNQEMPTDERHDVYRAIAKGESELAAERTENERLREALVTLHNLLCNMEHEWGQAYPDEVYPGLKGIKLVRELQEPRDAKG